MPKVIFELASPEYDTWLIMQFLYGKNKSRKQKIFKQHPLLKEILRKSKDKNLDIKKYVEQYYNEHRNELRCVRKDFQKEWNVIGNEFLKTLSLVLEINWSKEHKKIKGLISITPICPRFLKEFSFSIYFQHSEMKNIVTHEITHFLYFKKWKEVFPDIEEKQYEVPHIVWYLSEILAPVILKNPKIEKLIGAQLKTSYPLLRIRKKNALEYMSDLYKESLLKKQTFDLFLKSAYEEIIRYEKSYKIMMQKHY